MAKKFRILSIDGGGLRGVIPVMILQEIEKVTGKRIFELFDLIVGTSTGGIIACGLTATIDGKTPHISLDQLYDLYTKEGGVIFPRPKTFIGRTIKGIKSIFDPKFSPEGLDSLLQDHFVGLTLKNSLKPIIVTSYDLKSNEIVMFKSRKADDSEWWNAGLREVCRATSAAPTYLPSFEMEFSGKSRLLVDGGVYINNPVLAGVTDAIKNMGVSLENIECLSLGTGQHSNSFGIKTEGWGLVNWAKPITTVMMQASSLATTYESEQLLGKFVRLQVTLEDPKKCDMSDSSKSTQEYLISETNRQILTDTISRNQIRDFFDLPLI